MFKAQRLRISTVRKRAEGRGIPFIFTISIITIMR